MAMQTEKNSKQATGFIVLSNSLQLVFEGLLFPLFTIYGFLQIKMEDHF